ncbi:MAG: hypothetical protein ACRET2_08465 [Steroidobacteraceae bacterium]
MARLTAALLLGAAALALGACANPNETVKVGWPGYRTLPPGHAVSWPSSGTSNGAGCVPAPGEPAPGEPGAAC